MTAAYKLEDSTIMKLNTANLFNFLLLESFVYGLRVDSGYNMKQRKIATKPKLRNNWDETPETVITPLITMPDEKKVESEFSNLTKFIFKYREKLHTDLNKIRRRKNIYRKIRNAANKTSELGSLECLSCFGNGVTKKDEDCYLGLSTPNEKCVYGEECYVEIQANFIRRGCINKKRKNRTFVCKCPLCNDKPSDNSIYYDYDKISDWEFDNKFISKPLLGVDLTCKLCETKGTNAVSDRTCRAGKYADYMVCSHNQVCYTNIDHETSFVSRGCINKPISNSFLKFCNHSLCNFNSYFNPKTNKIEKFSLKEPSTKILTAKAYKIKARLKIILLTSKILQIIILQY